MFTTFLRIDATKNSGVASFFNDSHKHPNIRSKIEWVDDVARVLFFRPERH